jgi:hypothetical protein
MHCLAQVKLTTACNRQVRRRSQKTNKRGIQHVTKYTIYHTNTKYVYEAVTSPAGDRLCVSIRSFIAFHGHFPRGAARAPRPRAFATLGERRACGGAALQADGQELTADVLSCKRRVRLGAAGAAHCAATEDVN